MRRQGARGGDQWRERASTASAMVTASEDFRSVAAGLWEVERGRTGDGKEVYRARGYIPPEYIDYDYISQRFDVYSLRVIIIKLMAGNLGYFAHSESPQERFIELVSENWKERLQAVTSSTSFEIDILRVRKCVEIALRCVKTERKERPFIKDIVHELEDLEADIKKKLLSCDHQMKLITAGQKSSGSNILVVDPTIELRFPFEAGKDISCCLQLTNTTEDYIAFKIKTNQTKYITRPNKGFVPACSKCYVLVTLRAQEKAPANMQCNDMLLVHSANISKNQTVQTPDEFTDQDFHEKFMVGKAVEVVKLPIVYVSFD
nr:unnamed protein product [Digitaria exilis]